MFRTESILISFIEPWPQSLRNTFAVHTLENSVLWIKMCGYYRIGSVSVKCEDWNNQKSMYEAGIMTYLRVTGIEMTVKD